MPKDITLTCGMGVFTFDSDVRLSHAKLLRDTVMGQYYNPAPRSQQINTEEDVYEFVDTLPRILSNLLTKFDVEIRRNAKVRV